MAADSLVGLARELDAMPRAARRAILNALTATERDALDRRLAGTSAAASASDDEAHDHSPWLADRIASIARQSPGTITSASREALLRSIAQDTTRGDHTATAPPGRSLLGAMGGLLMPRTR